VNDAYIRANTYYLPSQILSNEDLIAQFPGWTVDKIASKVGINSRHISADDETAGDMAYNVAEKLFDEYNLNREEIDFVLLCTQSPDYFLPTTACILQARLKLSTNCGALDFNLGCSGYVYGLSLAKGLIAAGIAKNILFITSETYSKHIHKKDFKNKTIFGDASSATLISTEGNIKIGNFSLGTDGNGSDNLIVKTGCFKHPEAIEYDETKSLKTDYFPNNLIMNGSEVFKFTMDAVPLLVKDTLEKNTLAKDDVDYFIFHQANKFMLDTLRKISKIPKEKFAFYIEDVGNTVSSTIPIALKRSQLEEKIKSGDKILIAGFGVGYSWAGCILEYK
jgi:3-oxoacyl-[acyl-carrier-protein] synthase-3